MKKNKGVTLIASIITIIVLLILAGIGITMVTGQNGILSRAKEAKEITEYKSAKEKVKLAVSGAMSDDGILTIDKLKIELGEDKISGDKFPVIVTEDGKRYEVNAKGNVIEEGKINAMSVATSSQEELQSIYGASVSNYEPVTTTDVGWKIFYSDGNSIYLIADNYVEKDTLPYSTTEDGNVTSNKPNDGTVERSAYFTNILGDYSGTGRIKDNKIKELNKSYFSKNYESNNDNMKAVAYMLDTVAWNSKFKDKANKAEYAIGGPTIEMLFNSHNAKIGTEYIAEATNETGYKMKKRGGRYSNATNWLNNDSLFVISSTLDAGAMWIASSNANSSEVMCIDQRSILSDSCNANDIGFRPVICLNSNAELKKNADNTYTIQ